MQVIQDCWRSVSACECKFGAHSFENGVFKIYIHGGLDVLPDLDLFFEHKGNFGFVGHCFLVFHGVKTCDVEVSPYEKRNEGVVWGGKIKHHYENSITGEMQEFALSGHFFNGNQPCNEYVFIEIHAEKFELQVLSKNEHP
jgi:hypothetical protein